MRGTWDLVAPGSSWDDFLCDVRGTLQKHKHNFTGTNIVISIQRPVSIEIRNVLVTHYSSSKFIIFIRGDQGPWDRHIQIISHTTRSGMRCILTSIGLAALACLHLTEAFAPSAIKRSVSLSVAKTEEPCAIPSDFQDASTSLVNVPNSFKSIRSGMVTNSAGELIRLGDVISKNEPHVVIFLRHMG